MSLTAQAVVSVTHYLLDGATWANDRIFEQPIDPIADILTRNDGPTEPVLAVYVEKAEYSVTGRNTQGNDGDSDLKIIAYIAPGKLKLPNGSYEFELDGNQTAGLSLNVIGRQIDAAFHTGNAVWAAVWRGFILSISQRSVRYLLVEIENGLKFPAMEITYKCRTIPDPEFGQPMSKAWVALDAALRATEDPEKIQLADLFKSLMEQPAGLPAYRVQQNNFGLTDAALAVASPGPLGGPFEEGDPPVDLEDIILDGETVVAPEDE